MLIKIIHFDTDVCLLVLKDCHNGFNA